MIDIVEVDANTGVSIERAFTPEEAAQRSDDLAAVAAAEAERVAAEEAKAAAKASAIAKLSALGLTEDEAAALLGS